MNKTVKINDELIDINSIKEGYIDCPYCNSPSSDYDFNFKTDMPYYIDKNKRKKGFPKILNSYENYEGILYWLEIHWCYNCKNIYKIHNGT